MMPQEAAYSEPGAYGVGDTGGGGGYPGGPYPGDPNDPQNLSELYAAVDAWEQENQLHHARSPTRDSQPRYPPARKVVFAKGEEDRSSPSCRPPATPPLWTSRPLAARALRKPRNQRPKPSLGCATLVAPTSGVQQRGAQTAVTSYLYPLRYLER